MTARRNTNPSSSWINPIKGRVRRKSIDSELRSPPSHSAQYEMNDEGNVQVQYYDKQKREQKQQQSMNGGDDVGNEYDEEEGEEFEDEDQSGNVDVHGGEADGCESKGDNE
ncbi:hypothetical protein Lser_V15G46122 [Lactuca serriola]